MKRVLFILGQLSDLDIEWMIRNGQKQEVSGGTKLIHQGESIENIYIILNGEFTIYDEKSPGMEIGRIGAGEIVGEISFIDSRPPLASVQATERSSVYAIPRATMKSKLDKDREFAARFYYSIALFMSDRLRKTTGRLGYGSPEDEADELDLNVLSHVAQAGAHFGKILHKFSEV